MTFRRLAPLALLCLTALTAALAGVQLLPFFELLAVSQRSAAHGDTGMATVAAMPLAG